MAGRRVGRRENEAAARHFADEPELVFAHAGDWCRKALSATPSGTDGTALLAAESDARGRALSRARRWASERSQTNWPATRDWRALLVRGFGAALRLPPLFRAPHRVLASCPATLELFPATRIVQSR